MSIISHRHVRSLTFARARRRLLALAVAIVPLAAVAVVPATSQASALGYQYWGSFTFKDIPIPSGQLTHMISGDGYHIDWDGANYASAGNICDPSMKFTYGNGRYAMRGNVHWGCSRVGQWKYALNWNAPRGSACAELWAENWQRMVARQCHYVSG